MSGPLKYAVVERERRFLLASIPKGVVGTKKVIDRYVTGTRLRLREVIKNDGTVVRKLAHKIRLNEGPAEVACTNFYLNDQEWAVVGALPAKVLRKKRHVVHRDGLIVAIDDTRTAPSSLRSMTATCRPTSHLIGSTSSKT